MPTAKTLLLSVVARLLDDEAIPAQLLALGDAAAILMMADKSLTALFTPGFGPREALAGRLRSLVEENPGINIKLAIIGGEPDVRELLPRGGGGVWARRAVQLFHLGRGDGGWALWTGGGARPDSPLGRALDQAGQGQLPPADPQALAGRVETLPPLSEKEHAQVSEHRAFVVGLQTARPRATWGILGVLVAIFGCEILWGGSESIPTLVRMGANTEATLTGEPWRLLSAALLHAGVIHIAVNGYVLLVLGGFMEKLLGAARYGVLLGAAALGGSLASALLSSAVSVGASGAIWGVLGAAAALAWRPGTIIPELVVAPLRRNALINLGLGLAISLVPQVDLWAHLGGGVAGAALVLGGVVTRGLGRGERPGSTPQDQGGAGADVEAGAEAGAERETPRDTHSEPEHVSSRGPERGWTIAAGLTVGLTVASLAAAWITDRPWQLVGELSWVEVEVGEGVVVDAPALLAEDTVTASEGGVRAKKIGDGNRVPLEIAVNVFRYPRDEVTRALESDELEREGFELPPGSRIVKRLERQTEGDRDTFEVEYTMGDAAEGLVFATWLQLRPELGVRIESVRRPEAGAHWSGVLPRIYASVTVDGER
ncbi:MAG: rhomboid family intramembrane serine protease [Myxococcota bacterium]